VIAAVHQINILQLSLQFKTSGVAMTAVVTGDVLQAGTTTSTTPLKKQQDDMFTLI